MKAINHKLERLARSLQLSPDHIVVGLEEALWEAGPNPVTDFADALEFEGKYHMPAEEKARWEALGRFRDELTRFLSGKNAAFIGGVAVRSHGGRTGATFDYDVMIEQSLLQMTTSFIEEKGGVLKATVEDTYMFFLPAPRLKLDVRVARTPLDKEALATAQSATFEGRALKLVRPAPLAAMKVKSYSERKEDPVKGPLDRNDVKGLIRCGSTTAEEIRAILERHRPDLQKIKLACFHGELFTAETAEGAEIRRA